MKKTLVSVVIPTYNEKDNILLLIPAIKQIKLANHFLEILVVDDNSPDGTGKEVKKLFKPPFVRTFIRTNARGLGTAIKLGILKAKGEIIIGMDADFNHDPKVIPQLLKKLQKGKLVIASRFIKGGGMDDKIRFLGALLLNLTLRIFWSFPSTDNASGYYAAYRNDLKSLGLNRVYYGYGDYHLRLVYLTRLKGLKISEVPVFYKPRIYGKSKSNLYRMLYSYLIEATRLRFRF